MKKVLLILTVAFLPQSALGCTIPVFRYALENWELTPYEITVSHRGPLPADLRKALEHWSATPSRANVDITIIDLDDKLPAKLSARLLKEWKVQGNVEQKPWMSVRYRSADSKAVSALSGPCTVARLQNLVDSPARRAVLAHLSRGVCGVFVLVRSGDAKADKAAYDMAVKEVAWLEKKLKLPVQSKEGPQLRYPLPLIVSFPIVILDPTLPEEAAFKQLLLATEDGLDQVKGPILFAMFGRGRVLGSLSGDELNAEMLRNVAKFLGRECSCLLKELNPGVDMLMAAEWTAIFDQMYDRKEVTAPEKPQTPSKPTASFLAPSTSDWLRTAICLAAMLVLVTGIRVCGSLRK